MLAQGRDGLGKTTYERHQPEQTLLYQLVEAHYPALVDQLAQQGKSLPDHVHQEFEAYLKCGRLEHGFLRVRCDKCHFERLVAFWGTRVFPSKNDTYRCRPRQPWLSSGYYFS